jgi:hypothetical protein
MDGLLSFFSDLLLFTGGLAVLIFWILVIGAICIEVVDLVTGKGNEPEDKEK